MEIIQRATGASDGEIVPQNESYANIKEEVNRRTSKAGYTTKHGEPAGRTKIMAAPPTKKYEENYVRIFGHD